MCVRADGRRPHSDFTATALSSKKDVLAIDLPFFMSESDAIGRAKQQIPARYYDQTWMLQGSELEMALGVPPGSPKAFVFVLNTEGKIVARVEGDPT